MTLIYIVWGLLIFSCFYSVRHINALATTHYVSAFILHAYGTLAARIDHDVELDDITYRDFPTLSKHKRTIMLGAMQSIVTLSSLGYLQIMLYLDQIPSNVLYLLCTLAFAGLYISVFHLSRMMTQITEMHYKYYVILKSLKYLDNTDDSQ